MKRTFLCIGLAALAGSAAAQSTVSISGVLKVAASHGNGGTTPIDGATQKGGAMNDLSSALIFSGKEDLGGGSYAGFDLASFLSVDNGNTWASTGGPFYSRRSVVKLGGNWGELYLGRSLTPQQLMVLFADPWYWDGSGAQVGWIVQQAHYRSTSFIRTNNTVGYVSPSLGGLTLSLAASAGEGAYSKDVGGSLVYSNGPVWAGVAYDQSHGFFNNPTQDRITTVVGAYDFGVVRPMASFTSSKVNGASYKGYSLAVTAPVGGAGVLKAQYGHLDDVDTVAAGKQKLNRVGLGYQHNLSKRTNVFAQASHAKATDHTAKNVFELGIEHSF